LYFKSGAVSRTRPVRLARSHRCSNGAGFRPHDRFVPCHDSQADCATRRPVHARRLQLRTSAPARRAVLAPRHANGGNASKRRSDGSDQARRLDLGKAGMVARSPRQALD